jgi:hypothetical protein
VRTTAGSPRVTAIELDPGNELTVWRIVRSAVRNDSVLLNSLRSNYELGHRPRGRELSFAVIQMGLSAFITRVAAERTANIWPKLGDYIAEIRLTHGFGFNFSATGFHGHLTIWADPVKLHGAIRTIDPV